MAKQALLWQEPDNPITFCVNNNDQGDAFYQSTHTAGTKHGYHIDVSHTMSEQRRICIYMTSFCNITVDMTPLRRCMFTELKQFILINIIVLLK